MIATHSATGSPARSLSSHLPASYSECLSFQLGSVSYAIDILKVQEIRAYELPTRLFNAPACVKGVLNLRGVIVPVVDLRTKLGLPQADFNASTVTVILNLSQGVVGAVVDSVSDVLDLSAEQIKPAPDFDSVMPTHCIAGIASVQQGGTERLLMLLDIDSVLSLHAHQSGSTVLQ